MRTRSAPRIAARRRVTSLIFAGLNADRCVFSTRQDANSVGDNCLLVGDASATVSPDYVRDAVLYLVRQLHGVVTTTDAILAAIGRPDPAPLPTSTDDIRSAP